MAGKWHDVQSVSHKQPDTETHFLHKYFSTDCSHVSSRHCQQIYSAHRLLRVNMLPWITATYCVPEDSCSIVLSTVQYGDKSRGLGFMNRLVRKHQYGGRVLTNSATGTRHYMCSPWPSLRFPYEHHYICSFMTITKCVPHDHHYMCFPMITAHVPHDNHYVFPMTITTFSLWPLLHMFLHDHHNVCSPWPSLQVFPHDHHYTCSPWPPLHVFPFPSCAVITRTIHTWTMSAGSNSEGVSC
jgi:hypothetical protein